MQFVTVRTANRPYLAHREVTTADAIKDIQALLRNGWTIKDCSLQRPIIERTSKPTDAEALFKQPQADSPVAAQAGITQAE